MHLTAAVMYSTIIVSLLLIFAPTPNAQFVVVIVSGRRLCERDNPASWPLFFSKPDQ